MYDAVFVLVDAFTKLLKKKPDQFRTFSVKRGSSNSSSNYNSNNINSNGNGNGNNNNGGGSGNNNNNRGLECNTSKGWVIPWEHGDKISRFLRKVSSLCSIIPSKTKFR